MRTTKESNFNVKLVKQTTLKAEKLTYTVDISVNGILSSLDSSWERIVWFYLLEGHETSKPIFSNGCLIKKKLLKRKILYLHETVTWRLLIAANMYLFQ